MQYLEAQHVYRSCGAHTDSILESMLNYTLACDLEKNKEPLTDELLELLMTGLPGSEKKL